MYPRPLPALKRKAVNPGLPTLAIAEDRPLAMSDFRRPRTSVANVGGRSILTKPTGTQLYVPGFLADATQEYLDRRQAAAVKFLVGPPKRRFAFRRQGASGGFTQDEFAQDVQQDQFTGYDDDNMVVDMQQDQFIGLGVAPVIAAAGVKIASGLIKGSSTGSSNAWTDAAADRARAGDPSGVRDVVVQGGFTSNGGWHGAVGKGADYYARDVLNQLIDEGVVAGPHVDHNSWRTLPDGRPANNPSLWRLAPKQLLPAPKAVSPAGGVVAVPTPPPAIIPAKPAYALPAQASAAGGGDVVSVIANALQSILSPGAAPAPTPDAGPAPTDIQAGAGSGMMGKLLLAGLGMFVLPELMKGMKGGRRRR